MRRSEVDYYLPASMPCGLSYGQWTVLWWQWALAIPPSRNPLLDPAGSRTFENQRSDVWFLAGTFAYENQVTAFPSRQCKIPSNKSILFPAINFEIDTMYYPHLRTDHALLNYGLRELDKITRKECFINEHALPCQRIRSEPLFFSLYVHPAYDRFQKGGYTRAISDGYWVFLKPLPIGEYTIKFGGSCEMGIVRNGAEYRLKVVSARV